MQNRIWSFRIAFEGFVHAAKSQKNFQIQLLIGFFSIFFAWLFGFSRFEWLILLLTISFVLAAELFNTVIEVVVDLAVREKLLPDAKIAKDVSAAAVLLVAITAAVIGAVLFLPYFWQISIL